MTDRISGSAGRLADAALIASTATIVAIAAIVRPAGEVLLGSGGDALEPLCWWRALTGIACPTCGLSRSFSALAHGDLAGSVHHHPAGALLMLALVVAAALALVLWVRRRPPLWGRTWFRTALPVLAAIVLAAGLLRGLAASGETDGPAAVTSQSEPANGPAGG